MHLDDFGLVHLDAFGAIHLDAFGPFPSGVLLRAAKLLAGATQLRSDSFGSQIRALHAQRRQDLEEHRSVP